MPEQRLYGVHDTGHDLVYSISSPIIPAALVLLPPNVVGTNSVRDASKVQWQLLHLDLLHASFLF